MTWAALGEYRGPLSVRAFVRYAGARRIAYEREEIYRVITTRYISLLVGSETDYYSVLYDDETQDFDPEQVVDDTIAKLVD